MSNEAGLHSKGDIIKSNVEFIDGEAEEVIPQMYKKGDRADFLRLCGQIGCQNKIQRITRYKKHITKEGENYG